MTSVQRFALFSLLTFNSVIAYSQSSPFVTPNSMPTVAAPVALVSADFNGDGNLDLAVGNGGASSVSVYLNKGDGSFNAPRTFSIATGCAVTALAAADFNKDRKADLLVSCLLDQRLFVLPGRGDGTFGNALVTQLPLAIGAGNLLVLSFTGLAVADFNGDGVPDVAITLTSPTSPFFNLDSYLLLGRGDGTFQTANPFSVGGGSAIALVTGDFNGDGKPDLAALVLLAGGDPEQPGPNSLWIGLGDGQGSFRGKSYTWPSQTIYLAVADINHDGKLDLIGDSPAFNNFGANEVVVYLGAGDGTFRQGFISTTNNGILTQGFCLADLRGSGNLDMIEGQAGSGSSGNAAGLLDIRYGNGDGTFQTAVPVPSAISVSTIPLACADFNRDGRADVILTADSGSAVFANNLVNVPDEPTLFSFYAALPAGNLVTLLSVNPTAPIPPTFSNVNSASFQSGPLAAGSIVTAFGTALSPTTASLSGLPVPLSLGGVSVNVQDATGAVRQAPLFYVSPTQINYAIPDATAVGQATITIVGNAAPIIVKQQIVAVAPGIYGASGLAVGNLITVDNGVQTASSLVQTAADGSLIPTPINLGSGSQQTVLILYGTGIHNQSTAVTATIGSTIVPVSYAGPQGTFLGEDQINILLPASLRGAGVVNVILNAEGVKTNPVKIQIQ